MNYRIAGIFSSGTEYEIFRDNYCDNGCAFHKENEDGFAEFIENGGVVLAICGSYQMFGNKIKLDNTVSEEIFEHLKALA